jgi:hypothetical protein
MDEQKSKREVEWSFSFGDLGDSISQSLRQLGVEEEVKTAHFSEPVGGASSATVRLDFAAGKMIVHPLTDSDNLIEADVRYLGEMEFKVSGDSDKSVRLGQKTLPSVLAPFKDLLGTIKNHDDLRWDIGLSPNVPLDLNIHGGVGVAKLDLSGLQLKRLKIDNGVGESQLTLPVMPTAYNVDINGGVGETTINVPESAAVHMKVNGGVGSIKIRLPETTAARVEIQGGISDSKLAPRFTRVKNTGDFISSSGIWETAGFALSSQQVIISFHGGVGDLKVS